MLAGRHFAGEEYRNGFPGESVRRRSRCRAARRGGDPAGARGADRALGAGHDRVSRYLPGPRGSTSRVRCSRIWWLRSPTGRTASTVSDRLAVIGSMSSARPRRRPRCGASSTPGSTPPICPRSAPPVPRPGPARGLPAPPRHLGNGCTSMSTRPSPSISPTTKSRRPRPGRKPRGITPCWRFWTAPRSPAVKHWPGCCARATPAPTPPPTTSPSLAGRWSRCR
jgi:hypothetical protein